MIDPDISMKVSIEYYWKKRKMTLPTNKIDKNNN